MGKTLKEIIKEEYFIYKEEIDLVIKKVFERGDFILGEEVEIFEKEFADYIGVKYVISCGSGTDALILALNVLNLPEGTRVGIPMWCFGAVVEAVFWNYLEPVFYDNLCENPQTPRAKNPDEEIIKYNIVPHLFNALSKVGSLKEQFIIDDFSQAIGVFFPNKEEWFDMGICSFHPTKNLSCYGDGGAICTNDDFLAEKLRMLRNHGQDKKYNYRYVGMNSRLDTIQAAVLRVKLKHIDEIIELRKDVYKDFKYPRPLNRYEPYFEL